MKRVKWIKIAALGVLLYQSALPLAQVAHAEDLAPPAEAELAKSVKSVQSQNEEAIWSFDAGSGTLTISGGTIGADRGAYVAPWLGAPDGPTDKNAVKKIEFTGGVTGNASLNSLFSDYGNVEEIEFNGHFDTSAVTDMTYMFNDCNKLASVDVSSFNTAAVKSMRSMFEKCSSLTSIDMSNFNTTAVESMWAMFKGCSNLTSIDVRNFDVSTVGDMTSMFEGCSSLTSVDVSNFNTTAVKSTWAMFKGCSNLKSVDVSNFNTTAVENMRAMFEGCSSLTSVDVSNFNTTAVTDMYFMFSGCSVLGKLTVGPDFTFGADHGLRNATWYQNQTITPTLTTAEISAAHNGKGETNIFATGWVAEFDTQGGSLVDPILVSPTGTEEERTITKPTTDPTKSGFTFEGWYQDAAGTAEFDFTQPINKHTTIYAKWKENTNKVTFKTDGNGTLSGKNSVEVAEGKTLTANQVPTPVADKGYQFSKWIDSNNKTVTNITKVAIIKDQTFTAVFKKQVEPVKKAKLYRIYNPNSGEHFYTQNTYERQNLLDLGWHDEGEAGEQPTNVGENVYRLYNANVGEHHYTPHKSEVEFLKKAGWEYEGTAFKSGGNKRVHRLYNENAVTGTHHYTQLESEKDWLQGLGWSHEGTGWYSY